MVFKITIEIDGREVEILERQISGSPSEREEQVRQLARQGERVMAEAALSEAAGEVRRPCCCGRAMENRGRAAVRLRCLAGEIRVRRTRYRCRTCGRELYPADALLKCGRHRVTRPLAKRACQLATVEHFTRLPQLLSDQHGVTLGHEELVALVHDVGGAAEAHRRAAAMWSAEQSPPRWPSPKVSPKCVYVSVDGIMYCTNQSEPHPQDSTRSRLIWQQMRVGCVYWQDESERWHKRVLWGRESVEEFAASLFRLACECGYAQAQTKVFAADGGEWCWTIHQRYFAAATGILDWYHASEHVWAAAHGRHPNDAPAARQWAAAALEQLHESGGTGLLNWLLPQQRCLRGKRRAALDALITYIQPRQDRTDYPAYRATGLQIGTGMIESTAKQLVGLRLKGPGMHWTEAGALAITALRAHDLNENWHPFWNTLTLVA